MKILADVIATKRITAYVKAHAYVFACIHTNHELGWTLRDHMYVCMYEYVPYIYIYIYAYMHKDGAGGALPSQGRRLRSNS